MSHAQRSEPVTLEPASLRHSQHQQTNLGLARSPLLPWALLKDDRSASFRASLSFAANIGGMRSIRGDRKWRGAYTCTKGTILLTIYPRLYSLPGRLSSCISLRTPYRALEHKRRFVHKAIVEEERVQPACVNTQHRTTSAAHNSSDLSARGGTR